MLYYTTDLYDLGKEAHEICYGFCSALIWCNCIITHIARFMGPTRGPPGSCRPQMGPMLVPWNLLSRKIWLFHAMHLPIFNRNASLALGILYDIIVTKLHDMRKFDRYPTSKHIKGQTMCIILGVYCRYILGESDLGAIIHPWTKKQMSRAYRVFGWPEGSVYYVPKRCVKCLWWLRKFSLFLLQCMPLTWNVICLMECLWPKMWFFVSSQPQDVKSQTPNNDKETHGLLISRSYSRIIRSMGLLPDT